MRARLTLLALVSLFVRARAASAETAESTPVPSLFPAPRFALRAESAAGVAGGSFFNEVVGARADARFTEQLALGVYLGYANLKGHDGRAHNVLPALELEYRPRFASGSAFALPLRFTTGYLPYNGPVLRLSAGVSYAVSSHVDLVLDAFTPTFWVIRDRTVVSLGGGLEISYAP
jgi:hypothetical protein